MFSEKAILTESSLDKDKSPSPILTMSGVDKRFGATRALHQVALQIHPGSVHALIGENGAGKSTLMKILSGAILPDQGQMQVDGKAYRPRTPSQAREAGVAMIYQELTLAPDLNAIDNICLGREFHKQGFVSRSRQRELVEKVLAQLGCSHLDLNAPVAEFSVAEQQLLEIARALAYDAKIIIFDEPTSSLTQNDAENLFQIIDDLKAQNIAVVYISHFLEEIRRVADRFTVLRDGELAGTGKLQGATENEIVTMMVGREIDDLFPRVKRTIGEPVLNISELSGDPVPQKAEFELCQGEVLGFAGLVGAGRTELIRAIYGLDPIESGKISIAGKPHRRPTPKKSIDCGMAMVSEDRKTEGLAQDQSIGENITYSRLSTYSRNGFLNLGKRRTAVERWMKEVEIKASSQDAPVSSLSGGNQQKVAIARVLHQDADIYLLDEPTRGIDVGTKSEIYRIVGELAAAGKSIIVVSSYLPELMAICDRIAVMSRGKIRDIKPVKQWTEHDVMLNAVSTEIS